MTILFDLHCNSGCWFIWLFYLTYIVTLGAGYGQLSWFPLISLVPTQCPEQGARRDILGHVHIQRSHRAAVHVVPELEALARDASWSLGSTAKLGLLPWSSWWAGLYVGVQSFRITKCVVCRRASASGRRSTTMNWPIKIITSDILPGAEIPLIKVTGTYNIMNYSFTT
jgi:hypothetical protein